MFWTGRRTTTLYRSGAFQMFQAFRTFNPSRCSGSLEWMAHPQSQKTSHTLAQVHGCWREPPPRIFLAWIPLFVLYIGSLLHNASNIFAPFVPRVYKQHQATHLLSHPYWKYVYMLHWATSLLYLTRDDSKSASIAQGASETCRFVGGPGRRQWSGHTGNHQPWLAAMGMGLCVWYIDQIYIWGVP